MKKNNIVKYIKYIFIVLVVIDAFLAGAYVEQKWEEQRIAYIQEAIESGDKLIFTEDGIIRVCHDK